MKTRKRYILAKVESTYGTDPTPTASLNAILTTGLQRTIYAGDTVERNLDRATLGADEQLNVGPFAQVTFGVELAGSGTAGTAPAWGPLLRACGFDEVITVSTSVEYSPVSDAYDSVTIYYDQDGERQILKGARGTVQFMMNPGQIPMMQFTFTGLYAKPAAITPVTPVVTSFQTPLPVNKTNTPTCTLDTYDAVLRALEVDWGGEVPYLNFVNLEEVSPLYFHKPYYMEPQKGGDRAYVLLREALEGSGKIGIANCQESPHTTRFFHPRTLSQ